MGEVVDDSLSLAALEAEGIHSRTRVVLDASFQLDRAERVCVVDGSTAVGQTIAELFTEYLTREFGEDAFRVERIDAK